MSLTTLKQASVMITAMPNSLSRFKAVLGAGWVLLGLAAFLYARMKGIPGGTAIPVAAAFLIEFPFYLWAGFDAPREWLAARSKPKAACLLAASAVLPWLVYTIPTGDFSPLPLLLLLILACAVSFWYVAWPAGALADAAFLIVPVAAVRDEGTSYHYLPASREVQGDPRATAAIERALKRNNSEYILAKTWTTDALYRETHAKVAARRAEEADFRRRHTRQAKHVPLQAVREIGGMN